MYRIFADHREYAREIQVWSYGYVVQAESRKDAEDYFRYYVIENGDEEAVDGWTKLQGLNTELAPPHVLTELRNRFKPDLVDFLWSARRTISPVDSSNCRSADWTEFY